MRKITFFPIFIVLSLLGLVGCEFSASTANIQAASLSRDKAGTQTTTVFDPTDTFYSVVDLANAPDDTKVKAVWTAVNVGDAAAPNYLLNETELVTGSGDVVFEAANTAGAWPAGTYKVDIYLNDELSQTLDFRVQAPLGQSEPAVEPAQAAEEPATVAETDSGSGKSGGSEAVTAVSGAVSSVEDVRSAVVQIIAQGSFIHPEFGAVQNVAGAGSGFIIDPSGIAVTNNHVVTGSALLQVYLPGEDRPRNAKILGVSECSDLAVIDIDGDGFPYLQWHQGAVSVGTEMYVAGFPLGNPEYTLTRGIVSKEQAGGETNWASVEHVIEYDATTNGGNSGGAVVDANGQVIAVHYAGRGDTRQAFGISGDIAQGVVEQLRRGEDADSIGINGQAVVTEDGLSGIWVSSVKSGSPADEAGIRGGDIVTKLEGLVLATDGTMSSYCDVLRSRNADDVMSFEILRFATSEVLTGKLNSFEELTTVFSFAQELADEAAQTGVAEAPVAYEYVSVSDNSGVLTVSVPAQWAELDGGDWVLDGAAIGAGLRAAPSLDSFYNSWSTPGMVFLASHDLSRNMNEQTLLAEFDFSGDCGYDGRFNYEDSLYTGLYDLYTNCGNEGTLLVVLTAVPQARNYVILVMVQATSDADLEALDQILNTFVVNA
ncbi:MAG: trypsin-like peptidase domain-containing protein [Anaerolineales bacterium]|nr:trypsin-like peptidase domain-containing protein [Anaerolineales bacterium]